MIDVPQEIKDLFLSDNRLKKTQKKIKLYFYEDSVDALYPYNTLFPDDHLFPAGRGEPWLLIENERIESESMVITEALSETEDLFFGSCQTSMFEIIVADITEDIVGKEFTVTVTVDGYEILMGIYTVSSFVRQADRIKRKITAYDRMGLFNMDASSWYNSLAFPMTLKKFRDSLCSYIGVDQENRELPLDSMEITKTIEPSELSALDILKAICEINGRFGHINKMGKLDYKGLQQTGLYPDEKLYPEEDLFPSEAGGDGVGFEVIEKYKSGMTYEDYIIDGITGLTIRQEENDVGASVGTGEIPYIIEGNFLVYGKSAVDLLNIAYIVFDEIKGRTYIPAKIECNAMPWVEAGDLISIPTRDDIVETFVMKRITKGCQAMVDSIESTGKKERKEVFGINKKVIQLEGRAAVITKNVEEVSVRVSNLKENTYSEFKIMSDRITSEVKRLDDEDTSLFSKITQNAESITTEVSRATSAEGNLSSRITQNAESITSEVSRATSKEETLSSRITQNAEQISLRVKKGDVSSEISIEPDSVTFSGNRLIVDSTNFKLDADGNATFTGDIQGATGIYSGDLVVNNTTNSRYPVRITNESSGSYVGIGGKGLIVAFNKFYMKIEHGDSKDRYPVLEGGTYTSINSETMAMTGAKMRTQLDADGLFESKWIAGNENTTDANLHINSSGRIFKTASSSRRYKTDESTDLGELDPHKLYDAVVKTYKYKSGYLTEGDPGIGKTMIGFIVEDLEKVYPYAVTYEDEKPEMWNVKVLVPPMLKLIQEQHLEIENLKSRVSKME